MLAFTPRVIINVRLNITPSYSYQCLNEVVELERLAGGAVYTKKFFVMEYVPLSSTCVRLPDQYTIAVTQTAQPSCRVRGNVFYIAYLWRIVMLRRVLIILIDEAGFRTRNISVQVSMRSHPVQGWRERLYANPAMFWFDW